MTNWIKCSDRMPELTNQKDCSMAVLIRDTDNDLFVAFLVKGSRLFWSLNTPTHDGYTWELEEITHWAEITLPKGEL